MNEFQGPFRCVRIDPDTTLSVSELDLTGSDLTTELAAVHGLSRDTTRAISLGTGLGQPLLALTDTRAPDPTRPPNPVATSIVELTSGHTAARLSGAVVIIAATTDPDDGDHHGTTSNRQTLATLLALGVCLGGRIQPPRRRIAVGGPLDPGITGFVEGARLDMHAERGVSLSVFLNRPDETEIAAVRTGEARFAWIDTTHNGILVFTFEPLPWMDAPFNPHRYIDGPANARPREVGDDHRLLITIILVDATTGIVEAIRALTWDAGFVAQVGSTVRRLAASPFDVDATDTELDNLFARYSREQLAELAPPAARCRGGA